MILRNYYTNIVCTITIISDYKHRATLYVGTRVRQLVGGFFFSSFVVIVLFLIFVFFFIIPNIYAAAAGYLGLYIRRHIVTHTRARPGAHAHDRPHTHTSAPPTAAVCHCHPVTFVLPRLFFFFSHSFFPGSFLFTSAVSRAPVTPPFLVFRYRDTTRTAIPTRQAHSRRRRRRRPVSARTSKHPINIYSISSSAPETHNASCRLGKITSTSICWPPGVSPKRRSPDTTATSGPSPMDSTWV